MENNTAKHFALQLGSIVFLYLSVGFLLSLLFGLINLYLPDVTESYWQIDMSTDMVRVGIAMVAVFGPAFIILKKNTNEARRKDFKQTDITLTKWLIYLSLLVGGTVLLGNFVAVLLNFLEGELTPRFLLKALAVFVVIGATFTYYVQDVRGFWLENVGKSKAYGLAVISVAMIAVFVGFFHINSPTEARELRFDENQISDLREIQWGIQDELTITGMLPDSLDMMPGDIPVAPEGRPGYEYKKTDLGFSLCATFFSESIGDSGYFGRSIPYDSDQPVIIQSENWEHDAGAVCFERVVKY
jgi:hypothetical protein